MDIDDWLREIGLAQYVEMFRANDVDIELLGWLTNDDLKDIGVSSLGHVSSVIPCVRAVRRLAPGPKTFRGIDLRLPPRQRWPR
jgi:SAM domain (Sterile alpha motif)